jgi:AcrR family transcriptional regulator
MVARQTRAERAAGNRRSLLEAARAVFLRSGYHGASVDAIAAEAGFTIGAIYSRFSGKPDLFLALLEQRIDERVEQIRGLPRGSRVSASGAGGARQWAAILHSDLDWALLVVEFRVHAARDPELSRRFAELHQRLLDAVADQISGSLADPSDELDDQIVALARATLAVGVGSALARAAEGDAFSDELLEELEVAITEHLLRARPRRRGKAPATTNA